MRKDILTTHHIYPVSQGGTEIEENKAKVKWQWHEALHMLFGNAKPHDRIAKLLEWDSAIIQEPSIIEILELTHEQVERNRFYKKGVHK